jgi:TatA/E family protein of Tat protein translocase
VFGNLDPAKLLVILVLILVLVGPEKLPKVARTIGAALHEFQRVRQEVVDEVRAAVPDTGDLPRIPRIPSVRGALTGFISDTQATSSAVPGTKDGPTPNGSSARPARPTSPVARPDEFVPSADDPSMN